MSRYLIIALLCFSPLAFAEEATIPSPNTQILNGSVPFEVFESDYGGYTIEFPSTWEILPNYLGLDVVGLAPADGEEDRFRENVNIVFVELDEAIDRTEFYSKNIAFLKELLTNFNQEHIGSAEIDGEEARWIKYSHKIGTIEAEVLQYLLLKGKKAYVITCTATPEAFNQYNPIFQKVVESMQFTQSLAE